MFPSAAHVETMEEECVLPSPQKSKKVRVETSVKNYNGTSLPISKLKFESLLLITDCYIVAAAAAAATVLIIIIMEQQQQYIVKSEIVLPITKLSSLDEKVHPLDELIHARENRRRCCLFFVFLFHGHKF